MCKSEGDVSQSVVHRGPVRISLSSFANTSLPSTFTIAISTLHALSFSFSLLLSFSHALAPLVSLMSFSGRLWFLNEAFGRIKFYMTHTIVMDIQTTSAFIVFKYINSERPYKSPNQCTSTNVNICCVCVCVNRILYPSTNEHICHSLTTEAWFSGPSNHSYGSTVIYNEELFKQS